MLKISWGEVLERVVGILAHAVIGVGKKILVPGFERKKLNVVVCIHKT